MRKLLRLIVVVSFFTALPYFATAQTQSPGAKDDPVQKSDDPSRGGPGPGGGGSAPIGGGLFILLGLSAAYGGKKVYNFAKK